jgi:hypothetical protein
MERHWRHSSSLTQARHFHIIFDVIFGSHVEMATASGKATCFRHGWQKFDMPMTPKPGFARKLLLVDLLLGALSQIKGGASETLSYNKFHAPRAPEA